MKHYHRRHIWYQITISIFSSIIAALTFFAFVFGDDLPEEMDPKYLIYLGAIYIGFEILSIIYIVLKWHFTTYELTEDAVILNRGIIFKTRKNVPYDKIHAIDYKQNLIEKLFRIKKLSIDSGATMTADIAEIIIIEDSKTVETLTKAIQLKKDSNYQVENVEAESYIYKFSVLQKVADALFKSALSIVLIGLLLIGLYVLSYFFDDEHDSTRLIDIILIFAVCFVVIFGAVFLYLVIRYYKYQVKLEDKYIIISYGIFRKIQNTLALNRIKAIKIEEGFIRRLFKVCAIKLELVGFGSVSENKILNYYIPFCTKDELDDYINQLQLDFKYHDRKYRAPRKSFRYFYSLPLIIFTIIYLTFIPIIFIFNEIFWLYLGGYLLIGLLILFAAYLGYTNAGIYIDDNEVIAFNGAFNKKSTIILNRNITCIDRVDTYLRGKKEVASFNIHFYNNATKNVEIVNLLDVKIYDELINCIRY